MIESCECCSSSLCTHAPAASKYSLWRLLVRETVIQTSSSCLTTAVEKNIITKKWHIKASWQLCTRSCSNWFALLHVLRSNQLLLAEKKEGGEGKRYSVSQTASSERGSTQANARDMQTRRSTFADTSLLQVDLIAAQLTTDTSRQNK